MSGEFIGEVHGFNIQRMITLIGALALIKKLKDLASPRGTSSPLAPLREFAYSKEEIRENKDNDVSALAENSNRREKTWINRVFASKRRVEFPFLCERAFL